MIELNNKTQQDFLNKEWVQRLLDAGVDMSDAKYCIVLSDNINVPDYICLKENNLLTKCLPTYTVSELLYKLHEWIEITIDGVKYTGRLKLYKDTPFYIAYYSLRDRSADGEETYYAYLRAPCNYPIESLAALLIQCHEKGIGSVENISSK